MQSLRRSDGRERWRFRTRDQIDSSPVVVANRVFFGSTDGTLYAVGLRDGRERWRFAAGSPITASPAVANQRLVIGTEDGAIYCFGKRASEENSRTIPPPGQDGAKKLLDSEGG